VKRYLVTETENYHGQVISMTKQELPPNGKWLTREQVEAAYKLLKAYGGDGNSGYICHKDKFLDELFGEKAE